VPAPSLDVKLEGRVFLVTGACPNISFFVDDARVVADKSTDYKDGKCGGVQNGRQVKVNGVESGGVVRATKIELEKDNDDD